MSAGNVYESLMHDMIVIESILTQTLVEKTTPGEISLVNLVVETWVTAKKSFSGASTEQ